MSRSTVLPAARFYATVFLLVLAWFAAPAAAQGYPAKPLRLIVPFAPGGTNDIMARGVAPELSAILGQQVIVDNRGGASGQIGAEAVAKSPPDGYTLMLVSSSVMSHGPAVNPNLRYDMVRDFAPVGKVSEVPLVIVVHPSVPAKTTRQFIALAKARPNDLRMAIGGTGTTSHLVTELFAVATGTRMLIVPYKGAGPALVDLLGGHLDGRIDQIPSSMPHIQSNRLRAIAVTTPKRSRALPDVPTIADTVPGYDVTHWYGIWGPKGLANDIVTRWNQEVAKVIGTEAMQKWLERECMEPAGGPPEEFLNRIKSDVEKWKNVVKQAKIVIAQ